MTVGYTYLSANGKDLAVGTPGEVGVESTIYHPFLAEVAAPFNEIAVDWNSYYHEGEVVFGSEISCGQNHQFKPFFGVAGIYLEQEFALALTDQNTFYSGDIGNVDWKSEYWGVGLRFGSLYNYQFDQCFGLYGKFDASLLVGENKVVNSQEAILASESDFRYNVNFSQKEKCHFVPGYTVGAGFYMTPDICGNGSSISILVGYEFKAWHNIPNHRTFTGSGDDLGETAYSDSSSTRTWGTHGLVAGLQIGF